MLSIPQSHPQATIELLSISSFMHVDPAMFWRLLSAPRGVAAGRTAQPEWFFSYTTEDATNDIRSVKFLWAPPPATRGSVGKCEGMGMSTNTAVRIPLTPLPHLVLNHLFWDRLLQWLMPMIKNVHMHFLSFFFQITLGLKLIDDIPCFCVML